MICFPFFVTLFPTSTPRGFFRTRAPPFNINTPDPPPPNYTSLTYIISSLSYGSWRWEWARLNLPERLSSKNS